jgi:MraZ protein
VDRFRGNHPTRVDDKGRLKLPAEFKRLIDEKYSLQFFITSRDGEEAEIYPMPEWEQVEEKLAKISNFNAAKRRLMDQINFYGQSVEMDAQGRLLLPQTLREKANLVAGDVTVVGAATYLRVSNKATYATRVEMNKLTVEDAKELESLGV